MRHLPAPPPDLLYAVSQNADPESFRLSAEVMSRAILANVQGDAEVPGGGAVLDFGCGLGKALIGLHDLRPDLWLYGCDLDGDRVAWCREALDFARVERTGLVPPLPYATGAFDLVNAVSVFTHLDLDRQFAWAWELHRVLKPGGRLHMTVHGAAYLGLLAHVAAAAGMRRVDLHALGGDALFLDTDQPVPATHYRARAGEAAQGQIDIAVAHTRAAVETIFDPFEVRRHIEDGPIGNGQDAYVLAKPVDAAAIVCVEPERAQVLAEDRTIRFALPVDGQDTFRAFVTPAHPGIHRTATSAAVAASIDGDPVASDTVRLSRGVRTYGYTDHRLVEVRLPADRAGTLKVEITVRTSGEGDPEMLHWRVPHAFRMPARRPVLTEAGEVL